MTTSLNQAATPTVAANVVQSLQILLQRTETLQRVFSLILSIKEFSTTDTAHKSIAEIVAANILKDSTLDRVIRKFEPNVPNLSESKIIQFFVISRAASLRQFQAKL